MEEKKLTENQHAWFSLHKMIGMLGATASLIGSLFILIVALVIRKFLGLIYNIEPVFEYMLYSAPVWHIIYIFFLESLKSLPLSRKTVSVSYILVAFLKIYIGVLAITFSAWVVLYIVAGALVLQLLSWFWFKGAFW